MSTNEETKPNITIIKKEPETSTGEVSLTSTVTTTSNVTLTLPTITTVNKTETFSTPVINVTKTIINTPVSTIPTNIIITNTVTTSNPVITNTITNSTTTQPNVVTATLNPTIKTNGVNKETSSTTNVSNNKDSVVVLNKQRLQELVAEIDGNEQLEEDVEDMLLNIADDFIDNLVSNACLLAKHRGSKNVETKDVQLILEKNYNLYIPGFGSLPLNEEFKNVYKKSASTEAHKQRMALIKKTLKKF